MKLTMLEDVLNMSQENKDNIGEEIARTGLLVSKAEKTLESRKASQWPITIATVIQCETGFYLNEADDTITATAETSAEFIKEYKAFLQAVLPEETLANVKKDKNGEYLFRSAPETKNAMKYASSIGLAIEAGVNYEEMFHDESLGGKIPSKAFIEKLTKSKKGSLDALKKCLETADKLLDKVITEGISPSDTGDIQKAISDLLQKSATL